MRGRGRANAMRVVGRGSLPESHAASAARALPSVPVTQIPSPGRAPCRVTARGARPTTVTVIDSEVPRVRSPPSTLPPTSPTHAPMPLIIAVTIASVMSPGSVSAESTPITSAPSAARSERAAAAAAPADLLRREPVAPEVRALEARVGAQGHHVAVVERNQRAVVAQPGGIPGEGRRDGADALELAPGTERQVCHALTPALASPAAGGSVHPPPSRCGAARPIPATGRAGPQSRPSGACRAR